MNVMEEKFIYQLEKLCRMESIGDEIDLFFVLDSAKQWFIDLAINTDLKTDYKCIVVDAAEDMVEAINIIKENILSKHFDYFSADYEHMLNKEEDIYD